ncbi:ATP-binding protein [Ramlibacter humi]|uniref:ATP-binding protein n=1 Tax=Ramlibacter humi TaxID=2530451 RepID=UPI001431521F|nr:hypothetical protein [Ramlibacter humi]
MLDWQLPVALLAYLALRPGWHSRESLAVLLRPDAGSRDGRAYLRGVIHRMRDAPGPLEGLLIEDTRLRFDTPTDAAEFELAVRQGQWQLAVQLQHEPLLSQVGSSGAPGLDDWFFEERQRLRKRLGSALMAWITERQGEGRDAAELMQRLGEHDAQDEEAVQFLLEKARTPLERYEAAAAFRTLQRRLVTELGQKPLARTFQLHDALQAKVQAAPPPPAPAAAPERKAVGTPKDDAPAAVQPVAAPGLAPLGRTAELARIGSLLDRGEARLLTIAGLGGIGKTCLARAVHARLLGQDAACAWVDLRPVDTLHALLDTIAAGVGMPARDGSVQEQLAYWFAGRRMVVFLDNFEQLLTHAGALAGLLRGAPGLRFVVTSREPLRLPEEHAVVLQGLDCRGPQSPAFQLFALHAERLGHSLASAEQGPVAELVEYLEGLPLAIELATNWITLLPAPSILAELRADPGFVDSAAAPSGRSLRSVFHATWQQLEPAEQDALAALSTVQGTMDLEAARAIAQADAAVFLRLAHKSLLQRLDGRFNLHPLVREFARKLARSEVTGQAEARHAAHFLAEIARPPAMRSGEFVPERVAGLLPKTEDIAKAWRHAADHGRWDLVAAAMSNLGMYLMMTSRLEDSARLAAYARASLAPGHPLQAPLSAMQALAAFRLGRIDEAEEVASAALAHGPAGVPAVLLNIVMARVNRGREQGVVHAERAFSDAASEDMDMRMWATDELVQCLCAVGRDEQALPILAANLPLTRENNAIFYEGRTLALLGAVRTALGDWREGLARLHAALAIFQRMKDQYLIGLCQRGLSLAHARAGDTASQAAAAQAALQAFEAGGFPFERAEGLLLLGKALQAAGDDARAADALGEAMLLAVQRGQASVLVRSIAKLAGAHGKLARHQRLAVLAFAGRQPDLRWQDTASLRARLDSLRPSAEELETARAASAEWDLAYVCGLLLPGWSASPAALLEQRTRRGRVQ